MPRRSLRTSSGLSTPAKAVTVKTPPTSGTKRSRPTPKKSRYFAGATDDDSDALAGPSSVEDEVSGYEDEDASASEPSATEQEDDFSESDAAPAKRQKRTPVSKNVSKASSARTSAKDVKGKDLWREGVQTGLGPGTQVVIEKPKPRSAGKIPYQDHTIHPNTMLFLSELAENNDRQWLKMHDPDYRKSWTDFGTFLQALQEKLIEVDETIPELPTKDIIFRIYRDIRFSSDPTPYKTHFSAAWSRTGRKGPYAAYYVQIKPGGSFVGGGLWHPEADPVAKLRRDIDQRPGNIKKVLLDPRMRKMFFNGISENDKKAVKAFVAQNAGNALKTRPKGFDADHENIELLRLKNFTVGRSLEDDEVIGERGLKRIAEVLGCLFPFVTYLNSVVMPDEDVDSSDDNEEGEDDDDDDGGAASSEPE